MQLLVDQLRPVQQGVAGHAINFMADLNGVVHSLAWWFQQPTRNLIEALASPVNDLVKPGDPSSSRFFTELISPVGPMGSVFSLPAAAPNTGSCRDVVHQWIVDGCPLTEERPTTLRLFSKKKRFLRHPRGRIYGMGNVH